MRRARRADLHYSWLEYWATAVRVLHQTGRASGAGGRASGDGGRAGGDGGRASGNGGQAEAGNAGDWGDDGGLEGAAGSPDECMAPRLRPWAQWPMPNPKSAQLPHPQSFTPSSVSGGEIVADNVTGLVWERDTPSGAVMNWQSAKKRCASLTLGGYCGWRLPSRIELVSLLDASKYGPALDSSAFTHIYPGHCWSASTSGSEDDWAVNFYLGMTFYEGGVGAALAVRCVRGGATNSESGVSPTARYRPAPDGSLRDPATQLTWQATPSGSRLSLADAAAYCTSATPPAKFAASCERRLTSCVASSPDRDALATRRSSSNSNHLSCRWHPLELLGRGPNQRDRDPQLP
ncbi:MAG TPA: DUF1566 domain-containing protein [Polyangiaceae bacterium]